MYYDEQVINGVLCHRGTPNGKWIPFTVEQLTARLQELKAVEQQRATDFCRTSPTKRHVYSVGSRDGAICIHCAVKRGLTPRAADVAYECPKCGATLEKDGWCDQHGLPAQPRN